MILLQCARVHVRIFLPHITKQSNITMKKFLLLSALAILSFKASAWEGDGTEASPYLIATQADLVQLLTSNEAHEGEHFRQTANIDMDGVVLDKRIADFQGIYDGGNREITNFVSDNGLFEKITNATIQDVNLKSGIVENKNGFVSENVGGLVGTATDSKILNCHNSATVSSPHSNTGGIAGYCQRCEMRNCENLGVILSKGDNTGGVVGGFNGGEGIFDCSNFGTVIGEKYVGGLVGSASAVIENGKNFGYVSSTSDDENAYVGGVLGNSSALLIGVIEHSGLFNYGEVYAANAGMVGGVAGSIANGSNMANVAKVTGKYHVGGVAGHAGGMTRAYNMGEVTGVECVGGVSSQAGNLEKCFNRGTVLGHDSVAGLSNIISDGLYEECYAACKVQSTKENPVAVGAFIGYWKPGGLIAVGELKNCYYDGELCSEKPVGNDTSMPNGLSQGNVDDIASYFTSEFTDYWYVPEGNAGYPALSDVGFVSGNSAEEVCDVSITINYEEEEWPVYPYTQAKVEMMAAASSVLCFGVKEIDGKIAMVTLDGHKIESSMNGLYVIYVYDEDMKMDIVIDFKSTESAVGDTDETQGSIYCREGLISLSGYDGYTMRLYDTAGCMVFVSEISSASEQVNPGLLQDGVYIVNLTNGAETVSEKILF